MKRFYKNVSVGEGPEGFRVLLDGKPILTPAKNTLSVPTRALAGAIAEEWAAQTERIVPALMPLTRLANTVLDGVRVMRGDVIAAILRFGENDLLSYRAEGPAELAERQRQWDAHLDWAARHHGARLAVTQGIGHVEQHAESLGALRRSIETRDDFSLASLHVLASITGSLVLGLAVLDGRLEAADAFALSRLDDAWQAEKWGADREAEERAKRLAAEMDHAARLAQLART